jgi:hypothetical protein
VYRLDEATGTVIGNPAQSATIQDILKAVKNRDKVNGGTRNHAEAMSIDEMKKLMDWSRRISLVIPASSSSAM